MTDLEIVQSPGIIEKFRTYPENVKPRMNELRNLVIDVATEIENIGTLEETLRWGEPSYIVKNGSTIRMDWKEKKPDQFAMYFTCSSNLVDTFRMIYGDVFQYEKNRAIVFNLEQEFPKAELKDCIRMALEYHKIKHKPFLGR